MIQDKIIKLLNDKANEDYFKSNNYLQLSASASSKGLLGTEAFLAAKSQKALNSCKSIFNYLTKCGSLPEIYNIEAGLVDFNNIEQVFLIVHESEKSSLTSLNNILDVTISEKDYTTFSFLQEFANNQHEEEFLIRNLLAKIDLIGCEGKALYLLDKDIGNL